ncbi:UNVERIFIED_CONTAM: phage holin, LLH family [Kocuria sp. CPCC 205274]|uniref:Phage holin, LLH family n=1 Tax=Herbiconiux daphne TaxID=2970914 RepID=A0ABT2HC87_9MICO|nr:phage holin, LLH family [Herbiconiux daphne]MCS5737564.1 phage holin, LLH family [Herbiconiux daphne]
MINNLMSIGIVAALIFFIVVTALKVFIGVTEKDHAKNIIVLRARAEIIVRALDQTNIENNARKAIALTKLGKIAEEWKIPLSTDQASDYIESALNTIRQLENTKNTTE